MNLLNKAVDGLLERRLVDIRRSIDDAKILSARVLVGQMRSAGLLPRIRDAEFKVFSQFGDDGIIQYLLHHLGPVDDRFIEFGVQDYSESNTRFLLQNDNWRGLILDGSDEQLRVARGQDHFWRHDLTAVTAFVDRSNVNDLFRNHGFEGPIGLLSVDIDGNDYWVWEAIDSVDPVITVCEYNAVFGPSHAISVPYDPAFQRTRAHPSNLFWGASLKALCLLAERKGLAFVGANGAGNNAYFVRRDRLGPLRPLTCEEGFVDSRFRESRGPGGELTYLRGDARRQVIADQRVVNVVDGSTVRLGDLGAA